MEETKITENDNEFIYGKTVAAKACDLECLPDNIQELIELHKLGKLKSVTPEELEKQYFLWFSKKTDNGNNELDICNDGDCAGFSARESTKRQRFDSDFCDT